MKLSEWCKKNGISYQTGWRMFKDGKLPNAKQLPTGTIILTEETKEVKDEYNVVYARVSSSDQSKTNLPTQVERVSKFIEARGKVVHKTVKETGSGLNDKRQQLTKLLNDDKVTAIYVEHADRLTRFGLEYIKMICKLKNINLVIINETETDEEDVMQDFVSLVTSFCSRLYGLRRSKRKTEQIIKELENNDEGGDPK